MRKAISLLAILAFCFSGRAQTKKLPTAPVKNPVNLIFEKYRQALTDGKDAEAAGYIDAASMDYYKNLAGWIRFADSTQVQQMPIVEKFIVLMVRQKVPREKIPLFDSRTLFTYLSPMGLTGKKQLVHNTITDIKIDGNSATAQLVVMSQPQPFYLQFVNENGWKINLGAIFKDMQTAMQRMTLKKNLTATQLALDILEKDINGKHDPAIWKPIN